MKISLCATPGNSSSIKFDGPLWSVIETTKLRIYTGSKKSVRSVS